MKNELRTGMPKLPSRMKSLPVDERGYPVPWFVAWIGGKPEFRTVEAGKVIKAIRERRCRAAPLYPAAI